MIASALRLSSRRPSIAGAVLTRRTTAVLRNNQACFPTIRYFLTNEEKNPKRDSLRDAVNRIQHDPKEEGATTDSMNSAESSANVSTNNMFRQLASTWDTFRAELDTAWQELIRSGQSKDINKKIRPEATSDGDQEYTGTVEIMVIDEAENLSAWQRMQRRLAEAPIIQGIMTRAEEIYETSGAKQVKQRVDDLSDDAKEAWETSQNPWVYRISSVYDTVTQESEYTVAARELRKLDPDFEFEEWRRDVVDHTLPQIMSWFLEGKINQLKPWLGESVFKRIAAEITARKQEGVQIDTNVLGIMNSEILAVEQDTLEKGSPIILLHFMCQQINCVRKKEDGTIVEGAEDDIKANSYVAAFQREYDADKGELNWKIVDFRFNGAIAYL
jgi:mitochondrial import inner membrane translocase subunit TIM44